MNSMRFLTFISLIFLLASCSEELIVTGQYEETMVVTGLLNAEDSVHYIRVQRGYLNREANALMIAKDPDSIYYPDILDLTLTETSSGRILIGERVDGNLLGLPKPAGLFAGQPNILYRVTGELDPLSHYNLRVFNRSTGLECTSETDLAGPIKPICPDKYYRPDWNGEEDEKLVLSWYPSLHSNIYECRILFHYTETNGVETDTFKVEWPLVKDLYKPNDPMQILE